jgi:alkylation response protein AidB-like acyl-CoA dehydrogenase
MSAASMDDRADSIRMIRDSAAAVAPPGGELKRVRDLRFQTPGFDAGVFRQMGEMGWIGLRLPEALGGAGLGLGEACALAEELGAGLVPEPLIPAMLSAALLAAAGGKDPMPKLLAGEALVLTAWQERADTLEVPGTADAPRRFLPMAAGADSFLLPVREAAGLALYALPVAPGALAVEQTQDGGNLGTLNANLQSATRLADDIGPALAEALDEAALLTGAYLLGGMERAFAMTLDYLKTRQQFGRIIGTFQALQHRAADVKMQIALTRASIEAAAATLDAGAGGDARRAVVSRAKARAADAAMRVTRECIQLHGGIGYTDQYDVGLFVRKAMVLSNQYGSAALHRRRFMAVSPEVEE